MTITVVMQVLALDAATGYMVLSEQLAAQNLLMVRNSTISQPCTQFIV
jgi:hypothetical protein